MGMERREAGRRAEVVRAVVERIVQNPESTVTLDGLQDALHVPPEAATRIIQRLISAGVVKEVTSGVWARVPDLTTPAA